MIIKKSISFQINKLYYQFNDNNVILSKFKLFHKGTTLSGMRVRLHFSAGDVGI